MYELTNVCEVHKFYWATSGQNMSNMFYIFVERDSKRYSPATNGFTGRFRAKCLAPFIRTKLYLAPNTLGIDSLEIPKFLSINCVKLLHTKPYLTWNFSQRGTLDERIFHIVKHKHQELPWSTTCSLAGI
jgi:hypothetical protein